MMKKFVSLVLACLLCMTPMVAFGVKTNAELPKAYWKLQERQIAAAASGDTKATIQVCDEIQKLFQGQLSTEAHVEQIIQNGDTLDANILFSITQEAGRGAESLGDYQAAAAYYELAMLYGKAFYHFNQNDGDRDFFYAEMENKRAIFAPDMEVYVEAPSATYAHYKGAKHEPISGIYYGTASTYDIGTKAYKNEMTSANPKVPSSTLLYVNYPTETIRDFDWLFQEAMKKHDVLELAWNVLGEGADIGGVVNNEAFLIEEAKYLGSLPAKILLRFGAEVNVWTKPANPSDYVAAFRLVSKTMKQYAPNVAMVYSVNDVSAAGHDYEMYYPGDEYVDWVGTSLYTTKYFLGDKNTSAAAKAIYRTDEFANPVEQLRLLVETFGARKPIIITEGGVENYSVSNKEDLGNWAISQMEKYYAYIPMVYPEVKGMYYFDKAFEDQREANQYALYTNAPVNSLYNQLMDSAVFLEKGRNQNSFTYQKAENVTVSAKDVRLHSYFVAKVADVQATYAVDGNIQKTATKIPYTAGMDLSGLADGSHTLAVEMKYGNGQVAASKSLSFVKSGANISFVDASAVEGASPWATNEVVAAIGAGLVPASLQGKYTANITREEFCMLAMQFLEVYSGKTTAQLLSETGKGIDQSTFRDTNNEKILAAHALGIVNGVGDGLFAPQDFLSREQAATMLTNTAKALGLPIAADVTKYQDQQEIATWASEAVSYVSARKIMSGSDNRFNPKGSYTREMAYLTAIRMLHALKG